ncbi:MAG: Rpn family recombination-promoting nuclease/putative transposase [Bdellovibrionota bacterium]
MWDFAFKNIFGDNEQLFIDFVNSVFEDKNETKVKKVVFENTEIVKDHINGKATRLDVKALLDDETYINIEVQIRDEKSFAKRTLYYWSHLYGGQIESGDDFFKLKKSICINILNFKAIENECFHNVYGVANLEDHSRFLTDFEVHFLELPKWTEKSYDTMSQLEKWTLFLKAPSEKVLEELSMQGQVFDQAYKKLKYVSQDPVARARYDAELKYELDFNTAVRAAELRATREKAFEMARSLKALGVSLDIIVKASGLDLEQIEQA